MNINPESQYIVTTTDTEIRCQRPDGSVRRLPFAKLNSVVIETNDQGPAGTDFWWILSGEGDDECVFPQGAVGEAAAFERLTNLPNFDHETFIETASSTENESFLCWQRSPPSAGAA